MIATNCIFSEILSKKVSNNIINAQFIDKCVLVATVF